MSAMIAKFCGSSKQNIAALGAYCDGVDKSINQIVAEAVRAYMGTAWNRTTLAKAAGVSPNTVGNCIDPGRREPSASGKEPSIKLSELALIASALGVTVADLVTDRTQAERADLHRRRAADHYAAHGALPNWAPSQPNSTGTDG